MTKDFTAAQNFFFPARHFRNGVPFTIIQFFVCSIGSLLIIFFGGSLLSDPYYCDFYIDCDGSSLLGYKVSDIGKYSPASIPFFWSLFPALVWSMVFFSFFTLRNFLPEPDIILTPRRDVILRKHIIFYFSLGLVSYAFLLTPIEVIDDRPIDFAAITFYPLILFYGTGMAVLGAFPVVFLCMLVKAAASGVSNEQR